MTKKIQIHKIIKNEEQIIKDIKNKTPNKQYNLVTNIVKKSLISYIMKDKNIYKYYDFSYKTQKHNLNLIISEIIELIKYAKTYRSSQNIPKSTLFDHFKKLTKLGILKNTYRELLEVYLTKTPTKKLKQRYTDTTFIVNKYGTENIGYSGKHKRTGTKVSLDTDLNGVVLRDYIDSGNVYDSKIYMKQYNNPYYSDKVIKYNKILIADSGYDSSLIKNACKNDNIKPIIKYNKRKCKDETIINSNKFDKKTFEVYRTRFSIEKTNGLLKSIHRIQTRYDRKKTHFQTSLLYSYIFYIINILIKM